jgi:hypothetical protein
MHVSLLTAPLVLGVVTTALCQPTSRIELAPLIRLDTVFIEGDAKGGTPVAGVATTFNLSKTYGVDAELTRAWGRIERSYQGWFVSYVQGPNPTREEIERLAPIARRSLGYAPGLGWAVAFVTRSKISPRVGLAARIGASGRRYVQTSTYTILSIPEGVDPARVARDFQDSSHRRVRGGLLFGLDLPLAVTDQLSVTPEVRFVYGGPARIGDKHRELGLGARGHWRF